MNMIIPFRVNAIMGGQFGSEAKGLVAAHIALNDGYDGPLVCTTNAGAQAGHTTVLEDGSKFVCYHLPTIGVLRPMSMIYLNAGSIIDLDLFDKEISSVAQATGQTRESLISRIVVHPNATIISDTAKGSEAGGSTTHLGSTQKGVGAALAEKTMRQPKAVAKAEARWFSVRELDLHDKTVTMEIPQGTGLSLNSSGFYPKVTSRECWLGQGLVDAGVHPVALGSSTMVVRTFPIRVGHITDDNGEILGHSGPFYEDGGEVYWDQLPGIEPERTTVTKRVRRIAKWSTAQYFHGLKMNRPDMVYLTFTNYCSLEELRYIVARMRAAEERMRLKVKHMYSWGPSVTQVSKSFGDATPFCRQTEMGAF